LTRILPSSIVSVGFSHWTSLPAWIAITLISVPVVRRRDHDRVDVLAGEDLAEVLGRRAVVVAVLLVDLRLGFGMLLLSTSQTARTGRRAEPDRPRRFQWMPWLPVPMKPTVIFSLGATRAQASAEK
jgi:hypothetical protein